MFFAAPGKYEPCQMYSIGHLILFLITVVGIIIALHFTKHCKDNSVRKIIKISILMLWVLETIKIAFNFAVGNSKNPNNYIPLYYCSIILYAGIFSAFGKGNLKRAGDVFIATGAIVGGGFFLACPNTSLTMYPAFHYISIQSFIFHGTMVYLGILVNITNYVKTNLIDIVYYASMLTIMLVISYIVNKVLDTNFMFISKDFPNTPVSVIYRSTGKAFTVIMSVLQIVIPFSLVYGIRNIIIFMSTAKKSVISK